MITGCCHDHGFLFFTLGTFCVVRLAGFEPATYGLEALISGRIGTPKESE